MGSVYDGCNYLYCRLMVLYVPLAFIGSRLWGLAGLFAGAAFGNIFACLFAYTMIRKVSREVGMLPEAVN